VLLAQAAEAVAIGVAATQVVELVERAGQAQDRLAITGAVVAGAEGLLDSGDDFLLRHWITNALAGVEHGSGRRAEQGLGCTVAGATTFEAKGLQQGRVAERPVA